VTAAGCPVDGAAFERLMVPFEPFETCPDIAVAVSGGRDSLCLALLAYEWVRYRHGKLVALIVDHGLRPESADEARATARMMQSHGIESTILRWSGSKRASGVQEAARAARYRLLEEACRERGILHLLVAHHADDQAETIAMRAAHGSGPDGLAGMAALVETPDVRLVRPLLSVRRERLTATLVQRRVAWIDDPSNSDQRFERARLRRHGVAVARPDNARAGEEERLARAALDVLELGEGVALDRGRFGRLSAGLRRRLLSRVVQGVGGGDYPPRRDRLERALDRMARPADRGKSGRGADFTLSGCQFALRQAGEGRRLLWIVRPESGRKGRQPLIPAAFFACDPAAATHLGK